MSPSPLSCGSTFMAGGVTGGGGAIPSTGAGGLAAMSSGGGVTDGSGATSSTAAGGLAVLSCGGGGSMAGAGGGTVAGAGANASAAGSGQAPSAHQLGSCNCVTHDRWARGSWPCYTPIRQWGKVAQSDTVCIGYLQPRGAQM